MCGIVGYVGEQQAIEVVLDGLRRLEYRGYDSAGVSVLDAGGLQVERRAGKLANLEKALVDQELRGTLGIGHTRWATHGPPTDANAHPHLDCAGVVAVVHNGTIENYEELVRGLEERGHVRRSDTDTEVVAHLLEERYADGPTKGDLPASLRSVCKDLEGSFVLVVSHRDEPDLVVAARRNLPLVIGLGDGENFVGSDVTAFIAHTREARAVEQDQVVEVRRDGVVVTDLDGHRRRRRELPRRLGHRRRREGRLRVLHAQGDRGAARRRARHPRRPPHGRGAAAPRRARDERRGRPRHRAGLHRRLRLGLPLRAWSASTPSSAGAACPCRSRWPASSATATRCSGRNTLVIAVSQSGETADTLEAVRHARAQRAWVLAVTNTVGSTISRESDAALYTRGGPEVAVASTKAVMTQITAMYLVGLYLAQLRGTRDPDEVRAHLRDLQAVPDLVEELLSRMEPVRELAPRSRTSSACCSSAATSATPMALEGALKLKELAYVSAEGFPAGEIKHGPIALVEDGTPVVVIAPRHALQAKLVNNVQEVRARGARTIVLATDGDDSVTPYADHVVGSRHQVAAHAAADARAAAGLLGRGGPRPRPRRRPAAQPGEVRHVE
jgi:glucosamine--fructose-6-phosphate aminotransferase (isomerizing)